MSSALRSDQVELIQMLMAELASVSDPSVDCDSLSLYEYMQESAQTLESLTNAAELLAMNDLANHWRWLKDNFLLIADSLLNLGQLQPAEVVRALCGWHQVYVGILSAISNQTDQNDVKKLRELFLHFTTLSIWQNPLTATESSQLINHIMQSEVVCEDASTKIPTQVSAELISMELSDQVNTDLFEGLLVELPNQVEQFSRAINNYVQNGDLKSKKEFLLVAQRVAHTIKGAANVVGIKGLANLMHFTEDLLEEIDLADQLPPSNICQLLVDVSDTLAVLSDALLDGDRSGHSVGEWEIGVMQAVLDAYHAIHADRLQEGVKIGLASYKKDLSSTRNEQPQKKLSIASNGLDQINSNRITDSQSDPIKVQVEPTQDAADSSQLLVRIKEDRAQDLLRLAGENAIANNQLQTQVETLKLQLQHIQQLHHKLFQITEEFGHLIEVKELFSAKQKSAKDSELDPLELDRYNELHSFFHQLQEFATDAQDAIAQAQQQSRGLDEIGHQQHTANRIVQGHLLEMRMIPVSQLESRFARCVRQAARMTQKNVQFIFNGGDTQIDSRLLHDMVDPIMHLLRNAVDHGFSSVENLTDARVELRFYLQGQFIYIQVIDNGAGLQIDRISQKAKSLGFVQPAHASDDVLKTWYKQLIFSPGFSTRDTITQTSGRGIGLDVVADRVAHAKGRITVDSEQANGCTFTIRLPMTMIAEQALLVKQGNQPLVITARGVEQLLFLDHEFLREDSQGWTYLFNDEPLRILSLSQLARLPDMPPTLPANAQSLLLVEGLPGQQVGVLVERVLASREMVVKPLNGLTLPISGMVGASILGDGSVAPVLDVQQLVIDFWQAGYEWTSQISADSLETKRQQLSVLIVDDSLSTRKSLAQFVGDLGLDVRTAKDGFEAVNAIQESIPDLILVDMEMPRMNGLELTAHVRAQASWEHIPIIMITSRNTEKHRQLAQAAGVNKYLTKPFSEDELLHEVQLWIQQPLSFPRQQLIS